MQRKVFHSINSASTLRQKKGTINETQKWVLKIIIIIIIKIRGKTQWNITQKISIVKTVACLHVPLNSSAGCVESTDELVKGPLQSLIVILF